MTTINFIGATQDVTGSMTLVETTQGMLLIDCGLYQGAPEVTRLNLNALSFNPKMIRAIVLTHAHLDHSGYIPRLVKLGFRGPIYCTKTTMKLARVILSDSAKIMEEERHTLHNFYQTEDVMIAYGLFKSKKFDETFDLLGLACSLVPAGHILGAASVVIKAERTLVFSGDLGRSDDEIVKAGVKCPPADFIVMESTYGGKVRSGDLHAELISFLLKIKQESRVGIIASFAVARAQMLITLITDYNRLHPKEKIRLVIDGPMMIEANKIYSSMAADTKRPEDLLNALQEVEIIAHERQWESIKKNVGPLVIITSSGMVSGGRIWRYLENWQHDPKACLFLPGYQAPGTAGSLLSEGVKSISDEEGKIINWSGEVLTSSSFSSHADQNELISWLKNVSKSTAIYLNHGEAEAKRLLQNKLSELGFSQVFIARTQERIKLS